jgi:hypothetical protein
MKPPGRAVTAANPKADTASRTCGEATRGLRDLPIMRPRRIGCQRKRPWACRWRLACDLWGELSSSRSACRPSGDGMSSWTCAAGWSGLVKEGLAPALAPQEAAASLQGRSPD